LRKLEKPRERSNELKRLSNKYLKSPKAKDGLNQSACNLHYDQLNTSRSSIKQVPHAQFSNSCRSLSPIIKNSTTKIEKKSKKTQSKWYNFSAYTDNSNGPIVKKMSVKAAGMAKGHYLKNSQNFPNYLNYENSSQLSESSIVFGRSSSSKKARNSNHKFSKKNVQRRNSKTGYHNIVDQVMKKHSNENFSYKNFFMEKLNKKNRSKTPKKILMREIKGGVKILNPTKINLDDLHSKKMMNKTMEGFYNRRLAHRSENNNLKSQSLKRLLENRSVKKWRKSSTKKSQIHKNYENLLKRGDFEPKKKILTSASTQTEITSRIIDDIHEERMQLADINEIQNNTIFALRDEIRKLVTLKQYYPESEELILEEKELSIGTNTNSLKETFSFQLKTKNQSFASKEGVVELPIPPFKNNLKGSFQSDCAQKDAKQILRVSSHPLIKQADSFVTEGITPCINSFNEFFDFIKSKNLNEEIMKYTEFTVTTIQRNLLKYEEFVEETKKENSELAKLVKRLNDDMEKMKIKNQETEKKIKEIENNGKLESYDLLKEQKTLYKENSNLRRKVEKLERKIVRKSLTASPLGNKFVNNISINSPHLERSPPDLLTPYNKQCHHHKKKYVRDRHQKMIITDIGNENTRSFINEVRNIKKFFKNFFRLLMLLTRLIAPRVILSVIEITKLTVYPSTSKKA